MLKAVQGTIAAVKAEDNNNNGKLPSNKVNGPNFFDESTGSDNNGSFIKSGIFVSKIVLAAPLPEGKIILLLAIFNSAVEKNAGFVQSTVLWEVACCEKIFMLKIDKIQINKIAFFIKPHKIQF